MSAPGTVLLPGSLIGQVAVPFPDEVETTIRELREVISRIHEDAQRQAEPFVRQLIEIESCRTYRYIVRPG